MVSRRSFVAGSAITVTSGLKLGAQAAGTRKLRLGVNLAGAEFEMIGGRWHWPQIANLDYYLAKGFNIFRIPFKWERLQPQLLGRLDETAMLGLDRLVKRTTMAGAVAMLDSHDYGRRDSVEIGSPGSPVSSVAFADYWGRIARRYKGNKLVWYGLMNEPHDQDAKLNLQAQNAACAAIRHAGARSKVVFSGTHWTGAKTWVKSDNGQVMLGALDPAGNYAFDVHQYLEKAHIGVELAKVPGIGGRVLSDVYDWGRANNKKVLLGEFSINTNPLSMREVDEMLRYMAARTDVFIGATYFAGGGTWGLNPDSADPVAGIDKPQTEMMRRYL